MNAKKKFIWLLVILIPILHSSYTIDPDIYLKFIGLSFLLLIFIWYRHVKNSILLDTMIVRTPVVAAYLFFLFYSSISLLLSANSTDGIFEWYRIFMSIVLVLVLAILFQFEELKNNLPKAFTLLSLILFFSGVLDLIPLMKQGNITVPDDTYSITGVFGHRNLYAQMLFFTFPYSIFTALYTKEKLWKPIGTISIITSLFFLILLSNRATWIALVLGLLILSFLHFYHLYGNKNKLFKFDFSEYKGTAIVLLIATLLSLLFYMNASNVESVRTHTSDITDFDKGSTKDRVVLWKNTLALIKDRPLLGSGLSTWKFEILKQGNEGLESENNITFYQTPHNDFLWVFSEQGVIGLILYVIVFITLFYTLLKNIFLSTNQQDFLFNNITLFVFIGYCIYSVLSFPKERMESNIVFSLIAGTALAKQYDLNKRSNSILKRKNVLAYLILPLILLGIFIGVSRFKSETHLEKALQAKAKNNFPLIVQEIEKASGLFYKTDPTSTPLSWYSGSALFNLGRYNEALSEFQKSYEINPYHVHNLNNLASCYEMLGDHKTAIEYYQKAVAIAPNFEDAWLNMCAIYFNQKEFEKAYQVLCEVSLSTKNQKFKPFLMTVIRSVMQQTLLIHPNSKFQMKFIENQTNEDWFLQIHQYLKENQVSIEEYVKEKTL